MWIQNKAQRARVTCRSQRKKPNLLKIGLEELESSKLITNKQKKHLYCLFIKDANKSKKTRQQVWDGIVDSLTDDPAVKIILKGINVKRFKYGSINIDFGSLTPIEQKTVTNLAQTAVAEGRGLSIQFVLSLSISELIDKIGSNKDDEIFSKFIQGLKIAGISYTLDKEEAKAPWQMWWCEKFDSCEDGDPVAGTLLSWNTWGELTAAASGGDWPAPFTDDAYISSEQFNSGKNSLYLFAPERKGRRVAGDLSFGQDIILPFGTDAPYKIGVFEFSSMFYVNTGYGRTSGAYFNFQAEKIPSMSPSSVALECEMDSGTLSLRDPTIHRRFQPDHQLLTTPYPEGGWFELKLVCDLTNNNWELFINSISQGSFTTSVNQIASLDLYPLPNNQFFVDDVCWSYTPPHGWKQI